MSIESRCRQHNLVFGHWQIGRLLGTGSGGRSAVFQLNRADAVWEQSALKVVTLLEENCSRRSLSSQDLQDYEKARQDLMATAQNEVWLMSRLQGNTNVVDYLDHEFVDWEDETGFGCDMLVRMELLTDLRHILNHGKVFTEPEILRMGLDICSALILCHSKNIMHRDIKPENIFCNGDGNFKLGDFGISKLVDSSLNCSSNTCIGTPQYAAPEQAGGIYDVRVDLYSLGLTLYELANGNRLPFSRTRYTRPSEVAMRMEGQAFPRLEGVSGGLNAVILKACAYQPEDRFQSAVQMYQALADLCNSQTFPADGHSTWPAQHEKTSATAAKGNHLLLILTFVGVLVIFLGTAAFLGIRFYLNQLKPQLMIPATVAEESTAVIETTVPEPTAERPTRHQETVPAETSCPHVWIAATYDSPETCDLCGQTQGQPLQRPQVLIAAGNYHSVYVKQDGTVASVGRNTPSEYKNQEMRCDTQSWEDIVAVSASSHTVGLRKDGTVCAVGVNRYNQCNVSHWTHIIMVDAGDNHTVGLQEDGTVVAAGANKHGQCDVSGWSNIVQVAASNATTYGLTEDGRVLSAGEKHYGSSWTDIIAIAASPYHLVGLREDGSVVQEGACDNWDYGTGSWHDIVAISAGNSHTLGLTSDGRVVSAISSLDGRDKGQADVESWTDVVAISAGMYHSLALTSDGRILTAGDNSFGQKDIQNYAP